ncbi:hypothetical protein J3L16_02560 [Alteromonas sp. 5E99-2]|uniref:hypothetical protein n=1 Tax=Alteromonas sp. 5E99-2 TaxID=2817683 RepID=UPI001A99BF99|nr:hypothetical protein [Alteromonas sp. 5E99-2]MBO1254566.1 hypothetical protein [Alteromonas sp. 5E99-2]
MVIDLRDGLSKLTYTLLPVFSITLLFSGCSISPSTSTLEADSKSDLAISLKAKYEINKKFGASANFIAQSGDTSQVFEGGGEINEQGQRVEAIQINGTRLIASEGAPLDVSYDFDFRTTSVLFDWYAVNGDFYKLTVSPGVSLANYSTDIQINNLAFDVSESQFLFGLRLEQDFKLTEKLNISLDIARFEANNSNLFQLGGALNYQLTKRLSVSAGYQFQMFSDSESDNRDGCLANDLANECDNSDLELATEGFLLGLEVKF